MALPPTGVVHRHRVTNDIGGWRHHQELKVAPDTDLWRRAYESGYRFTFVPRLTAVKFPAAWRRNVYSERPHYEQAVWLNRIAHQSDLEAVETVTMLLAAMRTQILWREEPYSHLLQKLVRETARRFRVLLTKKGEYIEARRKFKGLGPKLELRK
jgi:hypothetical protein